MIAHLVFALAALAASGAIAVSAGQRMQERDLSVAAVDVGFIVALIATALTSLKQVL